MGDRNYLYMFSLLVLKGSLVVWFTLMPSNIPRPSNTDDSTFIDVTTFSMQSFILTFLAEWGDRSQIATIAVSSSFVLIVLLCLL